VTEDDPARAAFKAVSGLLERAGLLAGDGRAHLRDLWILYREREKECERLSGMLLEANRELEDARDPGPA
jgi:hypothetical protein